MEPAAAGAGPTIHGFGPGGFRIDAVSFRAALLTVADMAEWSPPPLAALTVADLQSLIDARPEFVLLGTGARLLRPAAALTAALEALDIGLEPMDSRAAARAWGVLRAEGRQVAAALYPLD